MRFTQVRPAWRPLPALGPSPWGLWRGDCSDTDALGALALRFLQGELLRPWHGLAVPLLPWVVLEGSPELLRRAAGAAASQASHGAPGSARPRRFPLPQRQPQGSSRKVLPRLPPLVCRARVERKVCSQAVYQGWLLENWGLGWEQRRPRLSSHFCLGLVHTVCEPCTSWIVWRPHLPLVCPGSRPPRAQDRAQGLWLEAQLLPWLLERLSCAR